jgi:hypothetical protein
VIVNLWRTILSICVFALAASASEQTEIFVPSNDVSFSLSTPRRTYRAGKQIILNYDVANASNANLYAPRAWEAKCGGGPHVWAWLENVEGKHFMPGYGGDCDPDYDPKTVTERMGKEAVLLRPGQHLRGTFRLDTSVFGELKPGAYRVEAVLYCWREEEFNEAERSELAKLGGRFLSGEVPASTRIMLTR